MAKKTKSIPVNPIIENASIFIGSVSAKGFASLDSIAGAHRDDYHLFCIQEKGTTVFEVDFKKYTVKDQAVFYIQPNQVHRGISVVDVVLSVCIISDENLTRENLKNLQQIAPVKPLRVRDDAFSVISELASLCEILFERKEEKLYHSIIKNNCNALVSLIASQYMTESKPADKLSRYEVVTRRFKEAMEKHYISLKRPGDYAKLLNISMPYLNECIKNTTGYSPSHHIQQRILLEGKRLLFHSDKSVKEIASDLGFDDYPYFSRLFMKLAGVTALTFRNKNLD